MVKSIIFTQISCLYFVQIVSEPVDIPAVAYSVDCHPAQAVVNLIHHAILPYSNAPPLLPFSLELARAWWTWILAQRQNGRGHSLLNVVGQPADVFFR